MKEFVFESSLWLPRKADELFDFFGRAANLEAITPPWLNFEILTPSSIEIRAGALIDYRLKVRGIPLRWRTEILKWDPPREFIDIQVRGPYKLWHHTHRFTPRDGGTLCEDRVRYYPRGGRLIQWLFVRRDVESIFDFRRKKLLERFGLGERKNRFWSP